MLDAPGTQVPWGGLIRLLVKIQLPRYNILSLADLILSLAEDKICGLFGLRIQGPSVYKISLNLEVSPWDHSRDLFKCAKTRTLAVPQQGKLWYYHSPYSSLHDAGSPEPGPMATLRGKAVNPGWPEMVSVKPLKCVYIIWHQVEKDCAKGVGKTEKDHPARLKNKDLYKNIEHSACDVDGECKSGTLILSCPAFIMAASWSACHESRKHWDICHHPGIQWWDIFNNRSSTCINCVHCRTLTNSQERRVASTFCISTSYSTSVYSSPFEELIVLILN